MKVKTKISYKTLAEYSAMMWNHGEDIYMVNGDNMVEVMEDGELDEQSRFNLDIKFLIDECKWHIESHQDMIGELYPWHKNYLEGWRDKYTVDTHNEYVRGKKEISKFKKDFASWKKMIELVDEWEFDTDTIEFITFDKMDKAVAKKK